jgi:hypothetical protein
MQEVKHFVKVSQYLSFLIESHARCKSILDSLNPAELPPNLLKDYEFVTAKANFMLSEYHRTEYYSMMELDSIEIPDFTAREFYLYILNKVKSNLTFH